MLKMKITVRKLGTGYIRDGGRIAVTIRVHVVSPIVVRPL